MTRLGSSTLLQCSYQMRPRRSRESGKSTLFGLPDCFAVAEAGPSADWRHLQAYASSSVYVNLAINEIVLLVYWHSAALAPRGLRRINDPCDGFCSMLVSNWMFQKIRKQAIKKKVEPLRHRLVISGSV